MSCIYSIGIWLGSNIVGESIEVIDNFVVLYHALNLLER